MTQATEKATERATETHTTSIPSRVDANHVNGEDDDASHVDAQPHQQRDLSLPPLL